MKKIKFAGIDIDCITLQEALNEITKMVEKGERGYIVTPNASHIVLLQRDKEFRKAYENASLVLADGMSLIWASKLLGSPLRERITGSDIFFSLLKFSSQKNYKIFLLGAKEQIIRKVGKNLQYKFPNLQIAGIQNGYFNNDVKIIEKINKTHSDILFVGMGFPKQEKWIHKYIDQIDTKVAICIGGVFDVVAGKTRRAPKWMQKIGLEWIFRLIQEPKRLWKRYLIGNTIFIFLVIRELLKRAFWRENAYRHIL